MRKLLVFTVLMGTLIANEKSFALSYSKGIQEIVLEYGIYTVEPGFHYGLLDELSLQGNLVVDPLFGHLGIKGFAIYHFGVNKDVLDAYLVKFNTKFDPHAFGGLWVDTNFKEVAVGIPVGLGLSYKAMRKVKIFARTGLVMGVGNVFSVKWIFYIGGFYRYKLFNN